ncbi:MAG: hypothetical protein ACFCVD_18295 [Nodosilinea sp.]
MAQQFNDLHSAIANVAQQIANLAQQFGKVAQQFSMLRPLIVNGKPAIAKLA